MKTRLLLLLLTCFTLASCLDDDTPTDKVETVKMEVSPMTCISSPTMVATPIEEMWVKVGSDADYQPLSFSGIQGFTFEPGYTYMLKVERTTLGNPPADGSRYTYRLLNELSKQPAECTREKVRLEVSAERGQYDWGIPHIGDAPCMKIRKAGTEEWTDVPFNKIEGFQYEDGYSYELLVEKITLTTQQPANSHCQTTQYVLKDILSQTK